MMRDPCSTNAVYILKFHDDNDNAWWFLRIFSCMQSQELERIWVNVLFLLLVPQRGMHFQPIYAASMTLLHLNVNLRLICLPKHFMCNPYMFLIHGAVSSPLFLRTIVIRYWTFIL